MPDLVEQIRRYADAAAQAVPETDPAIVRRRSRRAPRPLLLVAAAVVVAVGIGAAVMAIDQPEPSVRVSTDPPSDRPAPVPPDPTEPSTTTTGPATRSLRTSPVAVSTGTEYLVWSGEAGANDTSQRADGFAVDLGTGAVRPIPVAPIDPRSGATGVWTGTELIVCCGTGAADGFRGDTRSAAAWNPTTGDWRVLAAPPATIARSYPTSVWTGDLMIVVSKGPAAATYDPATDRWSEIAAPALSGRLPESVWTGEEMIVWDSVYRLGAVPGTGDVADQGWTWAPGRDAWTPLPPLPEGSRTQLGSIAWTGSELMVWGQSTRDEATGVGARWRPGADRWQPVPPSPQGPVPDPFNGTPGSQSLAADTDGRVLVKGLDGAATGDLYIYYPTDDTWDHTGLAVEGFHPLIAVIGGRVLVPDEEEPFVGDL